MSQLAWAQVVPPPVFTQPPGSRSPVIDDNPAAPRQLGLCYRDQHSSVPEPLMPHRNDLVHLFAVLLLGAATRSAHATLPPATQPLTAEGKALRKFIEEARQKPYRPLTAMEIKAALALPVKNHVTAAFLGNPGLKTVQPLPPGVSLEPDGYFIYVSVGPMSYSFLKAQTPPGKEVLFQCGGRLPWWAWVEAPGACGVAVIDVPVAREAQLKEASRLTGMDAELGNDDRRSPQGRAFTAKIRPRFEQVLRRCAMVEPSNGSTYAWWGRVSIKGKVVKSRVSVHQSRNGTLYVEESPYFDCVSDGMKNLTLPEPPHLDDAILWLGGFPAAFYWKHERAGDPIEKE
jgi:hypothetical protein